MFRILHISDIHFGKPFLPRVAEALLAEAQREVPDIIVASGDFTQRAKCSEYRDAAEFLNSLPSVPAVVTTGNHDVPLYRVWERLFAPLRNYREHIRSELNFVTRLAGVTIVSIDSTSPLRAISNGRIDSWQLRFIRDSFAASPPDDLRIVVAHHPLITPVGGKSSGMMPRRRRILRAMTEMEVDLVLGGHLHRSYAASSLDLLPVGKPPRHVRTVQCGTTTSSRGRGSEKHRNSCFRLEVKKESARIVQLTYSPEDHAFQPVGEWHFLLGKTTLPLQWDWSLET